MSCRLMNLIALGPEIHDEIHDKYCVECKKELLLVNLSKTIKFIIKSKTFIYKKCYECSIKNNIICSTHLVTVDVCWSKEINISFNAFLSTLICLKRLRIFLVKDIRRHIWKYIMEIVQHTCLIQTELDTVVDNFSATQYSDKFMFIFQETENINKQLIYSFKDRTIQIINLKNEKIVVPKTIKYNILHGVENNIKHFKNTKIIYHQSNNNYNKYNCGPSKSYKKKYR